MKSITWIVIVLIVIFGGWYYFSPQQQDATSNSAEQTDVDNTVSNTNDTASNLAPATTDTSSESAPTMTTVTYTANGFSPNTVTIKKGASVTFINQSGNNMWVANDPHPAHSGYDGTARSAHCPDTAGTAFDQCSTGDTYTFTFQKTGKWEYHNHVASADEGFVVVE
jgi:plastocyanin